VTWEPEIEELKRRKQLTSHLAVRSEYSGATTTASSPFASALTRCATTAPSRRLARSRVSAPTYDDGEEDQFTPANFVLGEPNWTAVWPW